MKTINRLAATVCTTAFYLLMYLSLPAFSDVSASASASASDNLINEWTHQENILSGFQRNVVSFIPSSDSDYSVFEPICYGYADTDVSGARSSYLSRVITSTSCANKLSQFLKSSDMCIKASSPRGERVFCTTADFHKITPNLLLIGNRKHLTEILSALENMVVPPDFNRVKRISVPVSDTQEYSSSKREVIPELQTHQIETDCSEAGTCYIPVTASDGPPVLMVQHDLVCIMTDVDDKCQLFPSRRQVESNCLDVKNCTFCFLDNGSVTVSRCDSLTVDSCYQRTGNPGICTAKADSNLSIRQRICADECLNAGCINDDGKICCIEENPQSIECNSGSVPTTGLMTLLLAAVSLQVHALFK